MRAGRRRRRGEKPDARDVKTRIFARDEGNYAKFQKMPKDDAKLLERDFSPFSKKSRMPKGFAKLLEML